MSFFGELKRRNVVRVGIAYAVIGWFIAQVAEFAFENFGAPEWVLKTVVVLLLLGLPLALFFAWAFELTPEGVKREKDVDRSTSITHSTGRKLDFVIIGTLVLALGYFIWERQTYVAQVEPNSQVNDPANVADPVINPVVAPVSEKSIAVLPFANRSNLDDDLFFTDGIHDDLLTQLAKIKDMKVISRTSVMQYRGTDKSIPMIAKELGVSNVLEGGVQRAGKRIRINAQLIDVETDEHLWAESFDREMTIDNLFDIQSEITKHIVAAVKGQLTPEERIVLEDRPTKSLQAWEAYSKAREILGSAGYNADKFRVAQPWMEQAVRLDPDFVLAQLELAMIHGQAYWIGYDQTDQRKQAARAALDKAIALAPDSPDVLSAQGNYLYRFEQDYVAALDLLLRARAAKPGDAVIAAQLGFTQRRLGQFEESVDSLLRSDQLDPGAQTSLSNALGTLVIMRDADRLRALMPPALARFPNSSDFRSLAADMAVWVDGDVTKARQILAATTPDSGEAYFVTATELPWFERDLDAVIAVWQRADFQAYTETDIGFRGWRELNLAQAYQITGDQDKAATQLAQVVELLTPINYAARSATVARQLNTLAVARALRGENKQAVALANEAMQLVPIAKDKVDGPWLQTESVHAMALAGHRDEALRKIEELLEIPNGYYRWYMYLDPRWDFFRDDERFNKLILPPNLDESMHARNRD